MTPRLKHHSANQYPPPAVRSRALP
ncbi:MAG: hypothetical protein K0S19_1820, partial [Geminicoccaceae bacterium]|nr:hypothetical protein [Geminicoccaceae bacterium]